MCWILLINFTRQSHVSSTGQRTRWVAGPGWNRLGSADRPQGHSTGQEEPSNDNTCTWQLYECIFSGVNSETCILLWDPSAVDHSVDRWNHYRAVRSAYCHNIVFMVIIECRLHSFTTVTHWNQALNFSPKRLFLLFQMSFNGIENILTTFIVESSWSCIRIKNILALLLALPQAPLLHIFWQWLL